MSRVVGLAMAVAVLGAGLAGCTDIDGDVVADEPMTVRVMQFNIEYGGDVVDFASVPAAIEAADADVVALQEAYGNTCKVADAVGWAYCDPRTQTLSRYPLITPDDPTGHEVIVAPREGEVFGVVNLHLPSAPFGPNLAAQGLSADELIAKEKGRLRALEPVMDAANRMQELQVPVVVLGDFNAPSHRDWTEETDGVRDHVSPVQWPVSQAVEDAGFVDAYRTIYPDAVEYPGLTWPAARPKAGSYNPALAGKPADRIDMTFVSEAIEVEGVELVGESASELTDIPVDPWPTDHRAVVSQLEVPLADPGPYVAPAQRLVDEGEDVEVFASGDDAELIEVTNSESSDTDVTGAIEVDVVGGLATLDTADLGVGAHTLTLLNAEGDEVASSALWVREPGAETSVTTSQRVYTRGDPIEVSWANAPGNKWDWIGVYKRGADPDVAWYKNWLYTESAIAGTAVIDENASGGPWPLPPGKYDVLVLVDDSYAELGRASFAVRPGF